MKLKWSEWVEHKKLLNEFADHRNIDGEIAKEIAGRIKQTATIEIPDDVYAEMDSFKKGIELARESLAEIFSEKGIAE